MLLDGWGVLAKHTLHRGRRDAMALGDLSDALSTLSVLLDGSTVQYQRLAADVLTFETSAPHAGSHSFDDQAALRDVGPAVQARSALEITNPGLGPVSETSPTDFMSSASVRRFILLLS